MSAYNLTETGVLARAEAMRGLSGSRNVVMDEMEKLYTLDVWKGAREPDEHRVTAPTAFTVVESTRSLFFTRRPTISVPTSTTTAIAQRTADDLEKHLYGTWHQTGVMRTVDKAEFNADCHGLGVFRYLYNPNAPRGELPMISQPLDPRTFYYVRDPTNPKRDIEAIHYLDTITRREVITLWGEGVLGEEPDEEPTRGDWLDQEIVYVDYWCSRIVEADDEEQEPEPPKGALELSLEALDQPELDAELATLEEMPEREGDAGRKATKRVIVNCVVADGRFVKEPTEMPGYEMIPYFHWSGISTMLEAENENLSVLFPVSGGVRENGAEGMIAIENQLLSLKVQMVERRAAAALIVNDEELADLDATPNAVNISTNPNLKATWLIPPGEGPEVEGALSRISQMTEDATISSTMLGRLNAAMSGVALSALTNPVLMRTAARQREREEVLEMLNSHILALTEEYAPNRGWAVWGMDSANNTLETRLEPARIKGYRRNQVKLSARLPRDIPGEAMVYSNLVQNKLLSRRTAQEQLQEVMDLPNQSPSDESDQVLVENLLFGDDALLKAMAKRVLQEYDATMAMLLEQQERAQQPPMPPQGPPPGPPMPPPGGMGQGPMMGNPPSVVPPQEIPPALGLQQMLAMGRPQPGPGRPPIPPGVPE